LKGSEDKNPYRDLIDRFAERIVKMRLTVPAIVILESSKPLSFVASQLLVFLEPIVTSLFNREDYRRFYEMLEERKNWEELILAIEEKEEKYLREKKK